VILSGIDRDCRRQSVTDSRNAAHKAAADRQPAAALAPLDVNQRYEIDEASAYLRISRGRLYEKVAAGQIRLIKDGRRSYVPGSEIAAQSRIA
jgi:excisionase family DNA binding protein